MSEAGSMAKSGATVGAAALPLARERFWNLPNTVTMLRIGAVPVLLFIPWATSETGCTVLAWCFIVAASSDLLDGYLARRGGEVTRIGKLLDPLADKLLISTALVMLLAAGRLEGIWAGLMVVVILGRELAVTGLRGIASTEGQVMAAGWQGKLKAVTQNVAVGALLFHYETLGLPAHEIGLALLAVAAVLTLWSGYGYFAQYFKSNAAAPTEAIENRDTA
ncbi:MAG: CDP-diacylglycerol--glycerol-3-phosphate 3-phosphatidyltransferase [Myxococcota bacterium]|nr:CDP-diacylglycerol--glycerol-3-phosphate 3-phosphatidyltransferase [Myxococcota bacterium]